MYVGYVGWEWHWLSASAVPLRHHTLIYRYRYRILAAWLRAEPLRIGEHYHAGTWALFADCR